MYTLSESKIKRRAIEWAEPVDSICQPTEKEKWNAQWQKM